MRTPTRAACAALAAAVLLAACTRTSGSPPSSCAEAVDHAIAHINDYTHLSGQKAPDVIAIDNPRETKIDTSSGRYPLQRFCKGDGRLADGTSAPILWVIKEKQDGWLTGFGFNACVVGREDYCVE